MALTIELVEQRLRDMQGVVDMLVLDLHEDGIDSPGDQDPEEFDEAERHYLVAFNRAQAVQAELERAGVAIDPTWTPPPIETRT